MAKILATENPADFRTKRVRISNGLGKAFIKTVGDEMNFQEMMGERKKPVKADDIYKSMQKEGYTFANLGISGIFTLTLDENEYLMLVKHDREGHGDFTDSVTKLVSGYIQTEHLKQPINALEKELSEEVLPITKDGKVMRFKRDRKSIGKPFKNHYENHQKTIEVVKPVMYDLPRLEDVAAIDRKHSITGTPEMLYHQPTNSAQIIYGYHLDQGNADLEKLKVSLVHTEDKFNPKKMMVETLPHPEGLCLVRLENGKLTDQVYTLNKGRLKEVNPKGVLLSEAFAPKQDGIVTENNIKLMDYLKNQ